MTTNLVEETVVGNDPNCDGVSHINIWINSKSQLGKMLSHFYESPFIHPYFGPFNSMEGFWHYIQNLRIDEKSGMLVGDDTLRSLSGMSAKNYGKKLQWRHVDNFHEIIIAANYYKIEQNPELLKLFMQSEVPLDYYYLFTPVGDAEGLSDVVVRPAGYRWLVEGFEELRKMFQHDERPAYINYDQVLTIKVK
jgi:hypothetical protein